MPEDPFVAEMIGATYECSKYVAGTQAGITVVKINIPTQPLIPSRDRQRLFLF